MKHNGNLSASQYISFEKRYTRTDLRKAIAVSIGTPFPRYAMKLHIPFRLRKALLACLAVLPVFSAAPCSISVVGSAAACLFLSSLPSEAKDITWTGNGSDLTWNTNGTDWTLSGDPQTPGQVFATGDNVTFAGSGSNTITLSGDLTAGSMTVNGAADSSFTFEDYNKLTINSLSGSGTVNLANGCQLVFSTKTASDFSGTLSVGERCALRLVGDWTSSSATINLNGTELYLDSNQGGNNNFTIAADINGLGTIYARGGRRVTFSGNVQADTSGELLIQRKAFGGGTVTNGLCLVFSGTVSGFTSFKV